MMRRARHLPATAPQQCLKNASIMQVLDGELDEEELELWADVRAVVHHEVAEEEEQSGGGGGGGGLTASDEEHLQLQCAPHCTAPSPGAAWQISEIAMSPPRRGHVLGYLPCPLLTAHAG
jgi:hypothetical protein